MYPPAVTTSSSFTSWAHSSWPQGVGVSQAYTPLTLPGWADVGWLRELEQYWHTYYHLIAVQWLALSLVLVVTWIISSRVVRRISWRETAGFYWPPRIAYGGAAIHMTLLFLVGLGLRLHHWRLESLETQEATEIYSIFESSSWFHIVFRPDVMDPHQFLFSVTQYALRGLFTDAVDARVLPAVFGALVAPLALVLFTRLSVAHRTAFAAAWLVALSPLHVFFSRQALPYAVVNVFATLLFIGIVAYCSEARPSRRARVLVVITLILGVSTHFGFVPLALIALATVAISRGLRSPNFWLALQDCALAGLLFMPLAGRGLIYVSQTLSPPINSRLAELGFWAHQDSYLVMYQRFLSHLFAVLPSQLILPTPGMFRNAIALVMAGLLLAGVRALWKHSRAAGMGATAPVLLFLFILAVVDMVGMHFFVHHGFYYAPRRLMMYFPFICLVVISGYWYLVGLRHYLRIPALLVLSIWFGVAAVQSYALGREPSLPDGRSAGAYLRDHLRDGDGLIVTPSFFIHWAVSYGLYERGDPRQITSKVLLDYTALHLPMEPFAPDHPSPGIWIHMFDLFSSPEAILQSQRLQRVWLAEVYESPAGWPEFAHHHPKTLAMHRLLEHDFVVEQVQEFRGITLTAYRRVSRAEPPPEGYTLVMDRQAYLVGSLMRPSPTLVEPGRDVLVLPGGRLDLPLPGAGQWRVSIEVKLPVLPRGAPKMSTRFLTGMEPVYATSATTLTENWQWLDYSVTVTSGTALPTYVWEYRPSTSERPAIMDDSTPHTGVIPLYVRGVRVTPESTSHR